MNYLKNSLFYLSGAIENQNPDAPNWRTEPTKVMTERFGINVFDPFLDPKQNWTAVLNRARKEKDYETMTAVARRFVAKDLSMVLKADALVAYLPRSVPTTGTTHEIIISSNSKKPTMLICPEGRENISFWWYGFVKPEFMFSSWDELYSYLDEVNCGKHKENRRWQFLCGLI